MDSSAYKRAILMFFHCFRLCDIPHRDNTMRISLVHGKETIAALIADGNGIKLSSHHRNDGAAFIVERHCHNQVLGVHVFNATGILRIVVFHEKLDSLPDF